MLRLLVLVVVVAIVGCDGHTTFSGQIVDGDGQAVSGAKITVTQNGHRVGIERVSQTDGAFDAGGTHAPSSDPLEIQVRKDGFKVSSRRVAPESVSDMRIVLEREKPPAPE